VGKVPFWRDRLRLTLEPPKPETCCPGNQDCWSTANLALVSQGRPQENELSCAGKVFCHSPLQSPLSWQSLGKVLSAIAERGPLTHFSRSRNFKEGEEKVFVFFDDLFPHPTCGRPARLANQNRGFVCFFNPPTPRGLVTASNRVQGSGFSWDLLRRTTP